MNIAIDINNYSIDNVYFGDSIKNAIIDNGKFMRIFYSNDIMTLNGIYFKIDVDLKKMTDIDIEKIIDIIKNVENSILDKINIPNKLKVVKISDYLMLNTNSHINPYSHTNMSNNSNIYMNFNTNTNTNKQNITHNMNMNTNINVNTNVNIAKIYNLNKMLLKISGIWETGNEYGLTFKFIEINRR